MTDTGEHGGIGDFVAVEVQDRQHRTIVGRVQKLIGMSRRGQWSSFSLTVTHHYDDNQVGMIESGAESMR
jgi:hypothetical protein